jgi:inorganic triphosphatase YgiF
MAHETELKLSIDEKALPALRKHPLLIQAVRKPVLNLVNTYYDTPDYRLRKQGIALRTRKQGRVWLQTIKCAATSRHGIAERPEWETPFSGAFDFTPVDAPEVARILVAHAKAVVALFTTEFRRETFEITLENGAKVLAMIDRGQAHTETAESPICELELELADDKGTVADLLELACELAQTLPLSPCNISKAQRGFALLESQPCTPLRAGPSPITEGMTPIDAFGAIANEALNQWQHNAAGAMNASDPEFVHQLRVALRRLRSALKMFAPALPGEFVLYWSETLGQAAADLGEARDLDVLEAEILQPVLRILPADSLPSCLFQPIEARRAKARTEGLAHLRQAGHGRLMLMLARDLGRLPSSCTLMKSVDLRQFAHLQLERLRKKASKRLGRSRKPTIPELHAVRIALKRLRYGLEFFAALGSKRKAKAFIKRLAHAQDQLGFLNDMAVAERVLEDLARENPDLSPAVAFVRGFHTPRISAIQTHLPEELWALLREKTPWS